jgi:hypothetical protein
MLDYLNHRLRVLDQVRRVFRKAELAGLCADLQHGHPSVLKRAGHRTFAMTDRYFSIAEWKLAAGPTQTQRAGGHRAAAQKRRGRLAKGTEAVGARKRSIAEGGLRAVSLDAASTKTSSRR